MESTERGEVEMVEAHVIFNSHIERYRRLHDSVWLRNDRNSSNSCYHPESLYYKYLLIIELVQYSVSQVNGKHIRQKIKLSDLL